MDCLDLEHQDDECSGHELEPVKCDLQKFEGYYIRQVSLATRWSCLPRLIVGIDEIKKRSNPLVAEPSWSWTRDAWSKVPSG